jgi:thioredoxin reductase (NADPH)
MTVENVIIIGSGPAGLTAALYTARANLEPLLFTGNEIGGQVSITNEVENYPGFPEGLTGPELVEKFQKQAERFGARIEYAEITEVDFDGQPFRIKSYDTEYEAKAIIIATGASARKLGVPGEVDFTGRGVSYCATCDGFFFRDKDVVVVGGGDSALEEGVFLTRFASRVRIIHRRDQLRASFALQERAKRNEKIEFVWDTIVTEINGDGAVGSVQVQN